MKRTKLETRVEEAENTIKDLKALLGEVLTSSLFDSLPYNIDRLGKKLGIIEEPQEERSCPVDGCGLKVSTTDGLCCMHGGVEFEAEEDDY